VSPESAPPLWHYTCWHSRRQIGRSGVLHPGLDGLLWATDLPVPDRAGLGLTSHLLGCDRAEYRYRIDTPDRFARVDVFYLTASPYHRVWLEILANAPDARPQHWWVTGWDAVPAHLEKSPWVPTGAAR